MKHSPGSDFLYQLFALIVSLIVVHSVYVMVVRPNADLILQQQRAQQAAGESFEVNRSIFVVIKDFEQEACFILAFWAIAIIGLKAKAALEA